MLFVGDEFGLRERMGGFFCIKVGKGVGRWAGCRWIYLVFSFVVCCLWDFGRLFGGSRRMVIVLVVWCRFGVFCGERYFE